MDTRSLLLSVLCVSLVKCQFNTNYIYSDENKQHPVIRDGVPIDTPEVQAAKAAHFEAYAKVLAQVSKKPSDGQSTQYYQPRKPTYALSEYSTEIQLGGPQIQQAKINQYSALLQNQNQYYRGKREIYHHLPELQHSIAFSNDYHQESYHVPVINKKGVPVDTPEVEAARQQHLLAHHLVKTGANYDGGHSIHIPVIAPNGIPYDTPEVHHARLEHLAAHAKETTNHNQGSSHSGYGNHYYH